MITLFLISGLGNQMFQYAFARTVQEKKGIDYIEVAPYIEDDIGHNRLMNLILNDRCSFITGKKYKLRKVEFKVLNYVYRLSHFKMPQNIITGRLLKFTSSNQYYYKDVGYQQIKKNVFICGQFQTHLWFDDYSDLLRKELKVKTVPSADNMLAIQEISHCNSVCVHIRRGDYLNPEWEHLNICNYKYYCDAIKCMELYLDSPVFFIFSNNSDDVEWIKQQYHFEGNIKYVTLGNPDYEELRLMYSCKHFIISNSSFSWWAQYLSNYQEKIVCAPSIWNRENDCKNIYMKNWILIDVE